MIIGLSGYAQSGKDSTAELLCLNYGYERRSFAEPMRKALLLMNPIVKCDKRVVHLDEAVDLYGWEWAKQNTDARRLLQVFGTEVGRGMFGESFWVNQALTGVQPEDKIVFSDVRFPNEAHAIKRLNGNMWRINRHNHSAVNGHKSEHAMDNFMFNHVIYNDGTIDDLSDEVFMLAKELGL
jgi:hypothetical protein